MRINKKILAGLSVLGILFASFALAATLQGFQGGTGFATSTAGNVGNFLQVASTSPFLTYQFASVAPSTTIPTTYVISFNGSSGVVTYAPSTTIPTNNNQITNGLGFLTNASVTALSPILWSSTSTINCPTCLTANQTITLTGPVTGSGATSIATTIVSPLVVATANHTTITASGTLSVTQTSTFAGVASINTLNVTSTATVGGNTSLQAVSSTNATHNGFLTQSGGVVSLASTTINGNVTSTNLTVTAVTSALGLFGSGGTLSAYGGASTCGAGQAVTTISAVGGTTCATVNSLITSPLIVATINATTFNATSSIVDSGTLSVTQTSTFLGIASAGTFSATTTMTIAGNTVSTSTRANPTATIGRTAVNGTANTFCGSDCAPALGLQFASSSIAFNIYDATTTAPYRFAKWATNKPITLALISCNEYAAATTTIEVFRATSNSTTTVNSDFLSSITCGQAGTSTTVLATSSLATDNFIVVNVSSTLGTPSWTTVNVYYQVN